MNPIADLVAHCKNDSQSSQSSDSNVDVCHEQSTRLERLEEVAQNLSGMSTNGNDRVKGS